MYDPWYNIQTDTDFLNTQSDQNKKVKETAVYMCYCV